MKRRKYIDFAIERIRNEEMTEKQRKLMIDILKLTVNDQKSELEDYLNMEWQIVCLLLEHSDNNDKVIRYHAQLDMIIEIYCRYFANNFDECNKILNRISDNLANKQLKKIQSEISIYNFGLFE